MTDYRSFLTKCATEGTGDAIADVTVDVIDNITRSTRLRRLTDNDPDGINDAIDAQLDRLIVASDGDIRLALMNVVSVAGSALTALMGPRP